MRRSDHIGAGGISLGVQRSDRGLVGRRIVRRQHLDLRALMQREHVMLLSGRAQINGTALA